MISLHISKRFGIDKIFTHIINLSEKYNES